MAVDKREQILVRLEQILTTLAESTDIPYVWRDRAEFDYEETSPGSGVFKDLPAYVLLDGTETKLLQSKDMRGPSIMLLQAQLFYVTRPTENQLNVGFGPALSSQRSAMITAVVRDGTLQDLVGPNGYIEYRGMETDMQTGGEVIGQLRLDFAFAYVLDFNKL